MKGDDAGLARLTEGEQRYMGHMKKPQKKSLHPTTAPQLEKMIQKVAGGVHKDVARAANRVRDSVGL